MERPAAGAARRDRAAERSGARHPRLTAYFDTSAFFKLLVREPGSSHVAAIWLSADRRVSSLLLYPEARAALARALLVGRIGARGLARARARLDSFVDALDLLGVTEALAWQAGSIAESYGVRAYDAVHLASAASVADEEFVLVGSDADLLAAASAIGLVTAPVL